MKVLIAILIISLTLLSCDDNNKNESRCDLEPDPGFCNALVKKYYYDKVDKACKEFNWGGCEGVVPFETLEECKQCEAN